MNGIRSKWIRRRYNAEFPANLKGERHESAPKYRAYKRSFRKGPMEMCLVVAKRKGDA